MPLFERIDIKTASQSSWDVIIAGSSFSAMFFLRGLPSTYRVLVVEKGVYIPHSQQLIDSYIQNDPFSHDNRSGRAKTWVARTAFGGNSNCWWGQVPRFLPTDFETSSDHGIGAPWPIGYDALEPFYAEVEEIMQVAGGGTEHLLPRSRPFPFPPHAMTRAGAACHEARPNDWVPVATARSNGGSRASCCGTGVCDLCPIDAKFTVENSVGTFTRAGVYLLTGHEVSRIDIAAGAAGGVVVSHGEAEVEIKADTVALAANGIYNAAILLRSGVAHPALGRYLNEQNSVRLVLDVDHEGYFGGSSISTHCYAFYDGPHRNSRAAVLIEDMNAPAKLRHERGRWTHRMILKLIAEDVPDAGNRIDLDGDGEPLITWNGHSAYSAAGLAAAEEQLQDILPFAIERIVSRDHGDGEAHIQGTHRMGRDPATSVTDDSMRLHQTPNLLALGSGSFPTCPPANPTLTLSALALRAGRLM
ncbi:MAG: GMC oxidoreductase [Pseudomonadota bacterium]